MRIAEQSKRSIKFRKYPAKVSDSQWIEIRKTIVRIQFRIGIHEPLSEMEEIELCRFLFKECKDINRFELENAFDLYCAEKLDFKTSHYNKLSNLFMGNVIGSFKRYRAHELSQHKSITYVEKPIDLNDYYERNLFQPYEKYCEDGIYPFTDLNGRLMYDDMWRIGIKICDSEEEREAFKSEARIITPRKKRSSPLEKEQTVEDYEIDVKHKAKSLAFKRWIEECSFNETDIRKIVLTLIRK